MLEKWKLVVAGGSSQIALEFVEYLAVNPYLTINKVAKEFKVAYSTAQRGVQKLEEAKIIIQISKGKRNKTYCATLILEILEEPATFMQSVE